MSKKTFLNFNFIKSTEDRFVNIYIDLNMAQSREDTSAEDTLDELLHNGARIEELPSDDQDPDYSDVSSEEEVEFTLPSGPPFPGNHLPKNLPPWLSPQTLTLFSNHPTLETKTFTTQAETTAQCLPLLLDPSQLKLPLNSHNIPHLNRIAHANFLKATLQPLPAPYVAADASRPWLFYWALAGLSFLDQDVSSYRTPLINTLRPLQNKTGGFGGGHGQLSHCAGTYAALLSLASVDALEVVDRKAMWHWLGSVKQTSGGFRMAVGAEEDVRGAYCALTALTLLNLPLELPADAPARKSGMTSFLDGLGEWVGRCQTFEGGISGAPNNEAHGAYAFCALACLSILDAPYISIPKYLDVESLARWLSSTQTRMEGGFAGRTEKLVDACYSHWVGGCWALLQAAMKLPQGQDLWNRAGLVRYLLCCGQQPGKKGGMRDKPSTRPDGYHTCYSLAGLSAAMNRYVYDDAGTEREVEGGRLESAFRWTAEEASGEERKQLVFDEVDAVKAVHPVFVLPMDVVEKVRKQFEQGGF